MGDVHDRDVAFGALCEERSVARMGMAGIVDPDCDVAQICRETAMHVQEITEEHTGRTPKIEIKDGEQGARKGPSGTGKRASGPAVGVPRSGRATLLLHPWFLAVYYDGGAEAARRIARVCKLEVSSLSRKDVAQKHGLTNTHVLEFFRVKPRNSCRATAEVAKSDREIQKRPIEVIVCADDHEVDGSHITVSL